MSKLGIVNAYVSGNKIVSVCRSEDGRLVREDHPAAYSVFYKKTDVADHLLGLVPEFIRPQSVSEAGSFLRFDFESGDVRYEFLRSTRNPFIELQSYEGDVHPIRRWIVDNQIKFATPRVAYLDLETDSRVPFSKKEEATILSWSIVSGDTDTVHYGVLSDFTVEAEGALLAAMFKVLRGFDLVCAWNGDGFDFPVIRAAAERTKIPVGLDRLLWLDHLELYKRLNTASESGEEKTSFRLNDVAAQITGETKDEFDASKTFEAWQAGGEERDRLVRYNVQDTVLLKKIEQKTGFISLFFTLAQVTDVLPDTRGLQPISQMDGYMLRMGDASDYRFKTRIRRSKGDKYEGAYVMPPETKGIERNIHVADFASLYPSIILTWNISPETIAGDDELEGTCLAPGTKQRFRTTTPGILPTALGEMISLRKKWNDAKSALPPGTDEWKDADRKSTAYKVAANSFYGVLGSPFSRYFDIRMAESITTSGVWLLKQTMQAAKDQGMRVVYADTDSVFCAGPTEEEFGGFVDWCNKTLYPQLLDELGVGATRPIKLAYEKAFNRVVFVGAKKYVADYVHYKGARSVAGSKPEIKGLEYKRRDTNRIARTMQTQVIDLILSGEESAAPYEAIVEAHLRHVLNDELTLGEVSLSKGISKELDSYTNRTKKDGTEFSDLVHVSVAKMMMARGEEVREGTRISYVVTGHGPPLKAIPASDYTGDEVDRFYLWEKLIYPPSLRLLAAAFPHNVSFETYEKQRPKKIREPKTKAITGGVKVKAKPRMKPQKMLQQIENESTDLTPEENQEYAKPNHAAPSALCEERN